MKFFSSKKTQCILAIILLTPFLSGAHVTLVPKTARSGEYTKLVFRVPHGCDGSPTTKITVQLPSGSVSVKPQVNTGWKIKIKKVKLNPPVTLHGKEITETLSEVTWEDGNLSDDYMDEFGISLKLPDKQGEKLIFPVIQTCKKGVNRWAEVSTGEHVGHSAFPAPILILE